MLEGVSKSTLQRMGNNDDIGYIEPSRKTILYDRDSINAFLEKHSKKPASIMKEQITSDKDYIDAFNQVHEFSKELGLKPVILKGLAAGNIGCKRLETAWELYGKELTQEKDVIPSLDLNSVDYNYVDLGLYKKDKNKAMEMKVTY